MHSTDEAYSLETHPLGNFASKLIENRPEEESIVNVDNDI